MFGYDGGVAVYTGYVPSDPLNMSLQEIWDYEDIGGFTGWYAPPVLIDCNGDSYLDVITGFSFDGGNPPDHRLLVLDGSPYNNNYRIDDTERIIFTWDPGPLTWEVCGQSPFLSETGDGTLEIGALFTDEGAGDVLYQLVDTLFGFHHPDYESYQREPWLKAFYSLSNWNNPEEDGPEY